MLKINTSLQHITSEAGDGLRTWLSILLYLMPGLKDFENIERIREQIAEQIALEFKDFFQVTLTRAIEGTLTWEEAVFHVLEELEKNDIELRKYYH